MEATTVVEGTMEVEGTFKSRNHASRGRRARYLRVHTLCSAIPFSCRTPEHKGSINVEGDFPLTFFESPTMSDPQPAAQAAFASLSFFLFSSLSRGSEFGVDGRVYVVDKFGGVKFLPPGLHLFLFSAAPTSSDSPQTVSGGVGVRHGLFRFFGAGETVLEDWDNVQEELISDRDGSRVGLRRRVPATPGEELASTVISQDRLKGLDATLAAYPNDLAKTWQPLVNFITPTTLARVIGIDERGNARVDAVMGSLADEDELKSAGGRQTWGKGREEEVQVPLEEEVPQELLRFIQVESKRSWPQGAVGEELTRWSKDKSWLLSDAIVSQLGGGMSFPSLSVIPDNSLANGVKEFLAEIQLSFVLFALLHNFSSLSVYKSLFSILCRSTSLLLPPADRPPANGSPYAPTLLTLEALPLYASFFSILLDELAFLDDEFFSSQMPGIDIFMLNELDALCLSLSEASPHWNAVGGPGGAIWRVVVERWDKITNVTTEKFGWQLSMIKGSKRHGYPGAQRTREQEDEVDLEDLEEGEDAPVIVDM